MRSRDRSMVLDDAPRAGTRRAGTGRGGGTRHAVACYLPMPEKNCFDGVMDIKGRMAEAFNDQITMNRPDFRSYREPCPAVAGLADSRSA